MKLRQITSTIFLLALTMQAGFSQNASTIIEKALNNYKTSNGVKADLKIHAQQMGSNADTFDATLQMNGDKFMLSTPQTDTWYDGTTQWVLLKNNDEVNITTPQGDELDQINPIRLLSSYAKNYSVDYLGKKDNNTEVVKLTPKNKSQLKNITITFNAATNQISQLVVIDKNNAKIDIQVNSWKTQQKQPESAFRFIDSNYPDIEIIDLR
ncbi:MAG: LolA family protein [Tannerellaceae bacterium]